MAIRYSSCQWKNWFDVLMGNANIDRDVGFNPPPQCMPDECKQEDTVDAYRDFYMTHKREFATWKTRTPLWFK